VILIRSLYDGEDAAEFDESSKRNMNNTYLPIIMLEKMSRRYLYLVYFNRFIILKNYLYNITDHCDEITSSQTSDLQRSTRIFTYK